MLASVVGVNAQEAYAVLSEDETTLTFYYDNGKESREGKTFELNNFENGYSQSPDWISWFWNIPDEDEPESDDPEDDESESNTISTVKFDSSFADARPTTTNSWFSGMSRLITIQGIQYLNTEEVRDMSGMFSGCSSLTSLDLSHFDTQNVTNMEGMFFGCSSFTSLDLSNFDTQNVTNMEGMFFGCSSFTSLVLSHFDTQNVTNMEGMFSGCSSLTSLDLSNFDTQNVTGMYEMFSDCSSLTSLDLSHFDTQNVTDMYRMFSGCSSLTSLDLSHFDTQNVTNMEGMFSECSSFTSLDLSHFDTQKVTNMEGMFAGCSSLPSLDLSSFDTENVTDMMWMFYYCSSLTSLDLSNFDTRNVEGPGMYYMFAGCSTLTSLDLSSFDTRNVTVMAYMFAECSSLTSLDLSSFDTRNVTSMDVMFAGCSSLPSLDLSSFDTSNVMSMYWMFYYCSSLKDLKISASLGNTINTISDDDLVGIGSATSPCLINQPDGFDFGVDTSGDYFLWDGGYFTLTESVSDMEKINVTTDLGYITYCSDKTLDFTNVEGMKAYIVVGYDGKVTKLSRIGIVPAETGLLLKAGAGDYEVPYTDGDNYVMDMLIGVLEGTTLNPTEGSMTNFVLANGNNGLGFYCLKGSGTLAAHRAYLQVPSRLIANGAKFIGMEFDDEATAIGGVTTQEEGTSCYYDMQGVRHEGLPSKQGIYIMNGKKVVVNK